MNNQDKDNEVKLDITEELFISCARLMKQYCEQMESCSVCPGMLGICGRVPGDYNV